MNGGMSAIGTKRTSPSALHMSAFDPKRTLPATVKDIPDRISHSGLARVDGRTGRTFSARAA